MKGKWKEHQRNIKGKHIQNERSIRGNEYKMKSTFYMKGRWKQNERNVKGKHDMCWLSTKVAFTSTEIWKNTFLVQRTHHLRKRYEEQKKDNMILGHLKGHLVLYNPICFDVFLLRWEWVTRQQWKSKSQRTPPYLTSLDIEVLCCHVRRIFVLQCFS